MPSFLQRLVGGQRAVNREAIGLQLRLLVAMAMADDRLHDLESQQIDDFIRRAADSEGHYRQLYEQLDALLAAPPRVDELLEELAGYGDKPTFGNRVVHELTRLAESDEQLDHREDFLIDIVCDVFGMEAEPMHDGLAYADLHRFVHQLAIAGRHAA